MRRALSPIISSLVLAGIAFGLIGIAYSGILAQSYGSMSCEIQSLEIHEIYENDYWGTIQAINNGDYDIENYDLSLFNDVITINEMTIGTIAPGAYIEIEFQIDDFTENDVMMVLEISNQDHISDCIKGAEL